MLVVVSRAGEAVEVEAALCTVDKGILSVRKEEVVIRSSRDRGGSKGVSGMAARIIGRPDNRQRRERWLREGGRGNS